MRRRDASAAKATAPSVMAERTVHNWETAILEAGRAGLAAYTWRRRSSPALELEAANEMLKTLPGEACVQLRVWQTGECLRPSRNSR